MSFDPVKQMTSFFPNEDRRYPLLGMGVLVVAFLFATLAVLGHGFLPPDDALRHAAQAVCKKPWSEILVMAKPLTFDLHAGWKWILFHLNDMGVGIEGLVCFSCAFFFLLVVIPPLFLTPRAEAWGVVLIVALSLGLVSPVRWMLGRPFLGQIAAVLVMGFLVKPFRKDKLPTGQAVLLFAFLAFAMWTRACWYLYLFPLGCLLVAGEWRVFKRMTVIWALACAAAATLCWNWSGFFLAGPREVLDAVGRDVPSWALVSELVPASPGLLLFSPVGVFLLLRFLRKEGVFRRLRDPMLIMVLGSWILAHKVGRFWGDFGVPALLVWMTHETRALLDTIPHTKRETQARFILTMTVSALLFLIVSTDINGRWGRSNYQLYADYDNEEIRSLFPDEGGIFYNTDMSFFYQTFFHNPNGHWKYNVGFEPAYMLPDNREIYQNIMLYHSDTRLYQGYIDKMTPKDRLVILEAGKPPFPELEWNLLQTGIWSGRLPAGKITLPAPPEKRD